MYIDVLDILRFDLNFTYTIREPEDKKYGTKLENGSWNGIIGELHREKADIGLSDLSVTDFRAQVVDFTVGLYISSNKLYLKIPKRGLSWKTFTDVFDDMYWLAFSCVTAAISVLFYVIFLFVNGESTIDVGTSVSTVFLSVVGLEIPVDPNR